MAVKEDYDNLAVAARRWGESGFPQGMSVVVLSPDQTQMKKLEENLPHSVFFTLQERHWNLNQPFPDSLAKPRVIIACNVFHYSPNPYTWFKNVFAACKEFWLQDLFWRPRGANRQLGYDGDQCRYSLGEFPYPEGTWRYNLDAVKGRILDYWAYDAGSLRANRTMINFVARLKGDLE